ncbi:KptA family-domain-containing protein [Aspergillus pseudoustus]|uniref:2'-phosphotransferase n=1 Tax=Aspergillus pseudoustus TaxID=1810923 RepID=A0ABR4J108_9EURO
MARGDRRGGGGPPSREVTVSKALSYLLRHAAEREGLKIDSQGYANVADVLAWRKLKSLKVTFPEIVSAVETSDKKRFALLYAPEAISTSTEPQAEIEAEASQETATAQALTASATDLTASNYLIRATQGHSIKSVEAEALLERLTLEQPDKLPETVVHGTFHSTWPLILESGGLRCMGRNHAHFATGPSLSSVVEGIDKLNSSGLTGDPQGKESAAKVISGMRGDAQVLIYIDLRRALEAGCPFWRSENGVILSEGMSLSGKEGGKEPKLIPVEFFDVVVERKKGLGKIWEAGEALQTLPDELMSRGNPKGTRGPGKKRR